MDCRRVRRDAFHCWPECRTQRTATNSKRILPVAELALFGGQNNEVAGPHMSRRLLVRFLEWLDEKVYALHERIGELAYRLDHERDK
jgi:hypothetical protein